MRPVQVLLFWCASLVAHKQGLPYRETNVALFVVTFPR